MSINRSLSTGDAFGHDARLETSREASEANAVILTMGVTPK
jgi:hypothetical protein